MMVSFHRVPWNDTTEELEASIWATRRIVFEKGTKGASLRKLFWPDNPMIALTAFLLVPLAVIGGGIKLGNGSAYFQGPGNQAVPGSHDSGDWLIVPGTRVGALALGDAETRISDLFPKPSIGQSPGPPGCGTEYLIGLLQDAKHPGFLRVFAKDGKAVEIEADRAHYHTAEGIASGSPPEDVQLRYESLESYMFLGGTYEALNMGPLVVWTDQKKGIAFSFVHRSRNDSKFSLSSIIVFKPGSSFCEEDSVVPGPNSWRKLAPYSLGPPNATAEMPRATTSLFFPVIRLESMICLDCGI
jgi:hypothetical protein